MKILVIGCGSIGTRRAKILAAMGHEVWGHDKWWSNEDAHRWTEDVGAAGIITNQEWEGFDAALVCTPPDHERVEQVRKLVGKVHGLFIEKPLALTFSDAEIIGAMASVVQTTMGACNLRFAPGVDRLHSLDEYRAKRGTFVMGQHDRFWSPNHKPISMALDSIHEIDLAVWLLGPIMSIRGDSQRDHAYISIHHTEGGHSTIELDRISDPPRRSAKIAAGGKHIEIAINGDPSMYEYEMQHFVDCVEAGVATCNRIEDAAEVCRWTMEVV